jgi:hypothetical protein
MNLTKVCNIHIFAYRLTFSMILKHLFFGFYLLLGYVPSRINNQILDCTHKSTRVELPFKISIYLFYLFICLSCLFWYFIPTHPHFQCTLCTRGTTINNEIIHISIHVQYSISHDLPYLYVT